MNISRLFLVLLTNTLIAKCVLSTSKPRNRWSLANTLLVYKDLDELLSIIRRDPSPLATMMVETFNSDCRYRREQKIIKSRTNRTKPFIIIDGNNRKNQDTVGRALAKQLNAKYVTHPAYCIAKYLKVLPKGSFLLRAFFHLSNYAANYYARYLHNWTVVLNGYWMEQLRYTVLNAYPPDKLPTADSNILDLPDDLLPSDMTYYLDLSDSSTYNIQSADWKKRSKDLTRLLQSRYPVQFYTIEPEIKQTIDQVVRHCVDLFRDSLFAPANRSETPAPVGTEEEDYC